MAEEAILLSGGNITHVVRIGQTVRRTTNPWSATVHHLLKHLEIQGFTGAPRFLGIDEEGREMLSFLPGEVGHYPLPAALWSDNTLIATARFLRRYHDVTANFMPPADAIWQFVYPDTQRHEVICHNDVAPYNIVYQNNLPSALIDFDTAGPGPRLWDIAYALYRCAPLSYAPDMQEQGLTDLRWQAQRLHLFCTAYGLQSPIETILATVCERLQAMCNTISNGAAAHNPTYQRLLAEGHLDFYQREIVTLQEHSAQLIRYYETQG